jgi:hypothetical protein
VTHLRTEHERLGAPREGLKWLPLRLKPRGTPDTAWIQVPSEIREFNDVLSTIEQLTFTEDSYLMMDKFGYTLRDELVQDKANPFGFFIGDMLGDASKAQRSEGRFPSVTVSMTLSKAKKNSEKFNEFAALSANTSLGVTMHRVRDLPPSDGRYTKSECFHWITPVTPLLAWVFRVVMGLMHDERTTHHQMRADWIISAPKSFRTHFLQGLAESDGWVDASADRVKIVASPNQLLLKNVFTSLDIPSKVYVQEMIKRIENRDRRWAIPSNLQFQTPEQLL